MRTADYSDDKSITLSYAGDSADRGKEFIADIGFTGFDSIPETVEVYYFDEQGERCNWPCEVSDGKVKLFCHIPGNVDLYVACGFVKSNTIKVNMIDLFNGIYAGNAEGGDDITDLLYMVEYEEYLWKKTVSDGVYSYWAGRVQFDGNTLTLTNECVLEDSDNAGITGENRHDFSDDFGFLDFTVTANWSEADGTITFNTYSYFDSGTGQQEERPLNIVFTKQQ